MRNRSSGPIVASRLLEAEGSIAKGLESFTLSKKIIVIVDIIVPEGKEKDSRKVSIYLLTNPTNDEARYISWNFGSTEGVVDKIISESYMYEDKLQIWTKNLTISGARPEIVLLDEYRLRKYTNRKLTPISILSRLADRIKVNWMEEMRYFSHKLMNVENNLEGMDDINVSLDVSMVSQRDINNICQMKRVGRSVDYISKEMDKSYSNTWKIVEMAKRRRDVH